MDPRARHRPNRLLTAGFALVVVGIALASAGLSGRAWSAVMVAGFALFAVAAARRSRG
jgi:hypothetical protein